HGGNITALNVISDTLSREFELPIATTTYWVPAREAFGTLLKHQTTVGHACEAETSMLLALAPDLVDVAPANHVEAPEAGLYDQEGVHIWRSTSYWPPTGVIGTPSAATAEKGEALLEAAATAIAQRLIAGNIWDSEAASAV